MTTSFPPFMFVVGCLVAVNGCSSTNAPPPVAPTRTLALNTTPPPNQPAPTPTASTTTQIRIDDAILKACGIKADRAFFAFDSAKLEPGDSGPLTDVAKCFVTGPLKGKSLKLIGRADPRGEHEYNMVLGQSRADVVGSFLKSKGLDQGHISTTSRGAIEAKGTDESTWAQDRRVDVLLGT